MDKISKISARQVLDSRGNPTIYAIVKTSSGNYGYSCVPSGASTGSKEALEMRDGDVNKFNGKGVLKAINNIHNEITPTILGMEISDINLIDSKMIELDGTEFKSRLGANSILAVSMACTRAGAASSGIELFRFIRKSKG